ncbi:hypothetical protein LJR164_000706 [Phenylobacterium sp. LjRoot164]|uniref:hypothetical protein n=1 Tax=unclassified Phenylobacterium TaxID=2640670 RepID=UPI003ECEC164
MGQVQEILEEVGRTNPDAIDSAAAMVEDAIDRQTDQDAAVVAMMIMVSLREHSLRARYGLN